MGRGPRDVPRHLMAGSVENPAFAPELLAGLPTPCLVVDLAAADRNIAWAAGYFAGRPVRLRPHFKAHKCSRLLARQLAAGGCVGVTCATAWEAEVLARAGFDDILVANQVADAVGLGQLATAARSARVTVCVDDGRHVDQLRLVAREAGVRLGVLVEIDVGMGRSGLEGGSEVLLPLVGSVVAGQELEFRGLQGYEGHAVLEPERAERGRLVAIAEAILRAEQERLEAAGYRCELVSGGGTGTFDLAAEAGALTEIQAGSYVLMDARYASLGLPFETALYCCATVISRQGGRAVLNAGLKALSAEHGMPQAVPPGLEIVDLSDEHAHLRLPAEQPLAVGDTVLVVPGHIDPTINLHGSLFVFTTPATVEEWPVDGRRA